VLSCRYFKAPKFNLLNANMTFPRNTISLDVLYHEHHQWLYLWLSRRLHCINDAADLSHDTYLRIMSSGRSPDTAKDCRPFLMQVAKGLVVDLHRRRSLERSYLDALTHMQPCYAPSTEDAELILELLIKIDAALDGLPANIRETFLLSRFEGLTYSAIAERIGVSVGSVRKYMFKASAACFFVLDS
jgi:RNA polymerase sigma-70 factor (ECF subfamily)